MIPKEVLDDIRRQVTQDNDEELSDGLKQFSLTFCASILVGLMTPDDRRDFFATIRAILPDEEKRS